MDIGFTVLMAWALSGTYSGMIAAIVAGLTLSLALYIGKHLIGTERLKRKDGKFQWVRIPV